MKKLATILLLACIGCTDEESTIRTLRASGFTDIRVGGFSWYGCGEGDDFATEFTARNPRGDVVSGVVCCGLVKNCTVRF